MVKYKSISILISTSNRAKILEKTLHNIYNKQNLPPTNFEVIVTNDGDEDLEFLNNVYLNKGNFKIVKNHHKKGLAGGRNNGVEYAKNELIIFFDDDILVYDDFFIKILNVHNKLDNIILGAYRIYPPELEEQAKKYAFGRYKLKHEYSAIDIETLKKVEELEFNNIFEAYSVAGFAMSMPKKVYELVGPFNETFEYAGCEDAEFCYRAKNLNIRCFVDISNVCYHNELDNFELKRWLYRQATGIQSAVVMCKLHPEGKQHPTWYLNAPIERNDSFKVVIHKIFKICISFFPIFKIIYTITKIGEFSRIPDFVLFRFYNLLWMASTFKAFRKAYKKHFG
ncbi:MAG: glycosyltransferase [Bacteroidales bacterium]|nr:glycosyltransferase [Bacteroidales bacterium]